MIDEKGRFVPGTSGNPMGKTKGAKSRFLYIRARLFERLAAEKEDKIVAVVDSIFEVALNREESFKRRLDCFKLALEFFGSKCQFKGEVEEEEVAVRSLKEQLEIVDIAIENKEMKERIRMLESLGARKEKKREYNKRSIAKKKALKNSQEKKSG